MGNVTNEIKIKRTILYRSAFVVIAMLCMVVTVSGQNINNLKLKNYRPVSIFKVPVTNVTGQNIRQSICTHVMYRTIGDCRVIKDGCKRYRKSSCFHRCLRCQVRFFENVFKYGNRFELWCGFDNTGYDNPGYGPVAVNELERCVKTGAKGVGEVMYKGKAIGLRELKPSCSRTILVWTLFLKNVLNSEFR